MSPLEDPHEQVTSAVMNSTLVTCDSDANCSLNLNSSVNRSGFVRFTPIGTDAGIQTENASPNRPRLRIKKRISTEEIKSACAMLSSVCGISNEMARKCIQIVAIELYGHNFYLTPEEQLQGERPHTETYGW